MVDIDYFKRSTMIMAMISGIIIIRNVAKIMSQTLFQYQLESQVFRIKGKEFGVFVSRKSQHDITEILETISRRVSNFSLKRYPRGRSSSYDFSRRFRFAEAENGHR